MKVKYPAGLAGAGPAVPGLLEGLLDEIPTPQEEPALNNPETPPLRQQRECIVYGLDPMTGPHPESRFAAVVFAVGRYRFAAALNMLDSVAPVEGEVTPLPGQPVWHRGVVSYRGKQLTLVDVGGLLELEGVEPPASPEHVLVLPGGRAGLLCDAPPEPLALTGAGIRWCRPVRQRPWLAALLPEQMCILMDVEEITGLVRHDSCL